MSKSDQHQRPIIFLPSLTDAVKVSPNTLSKRPTSDNVSDVRSTGCYAATKSDSDLMHFGAVVAWSERGKIHATFHHPTFKPSFPSLAEWRMAHCYRITPDCIYYCQCNPKFSDDQGVS